MTRCIKNKHNFVLFFFLNLFSSVKGGGWVEFWLPLSASCYVYSDQITVYSLYVPNILLIARFYRVTNSTVNITVICPKLSAQIRLDMLPGR